MSTLSELFPSGGTQNNIEFVAQGTLANGQTVALRSDGKVEAVTGQSGSVGTKVVFEAATSTAMAGTYDSANNKVVFLYNDYGNSYYGTAIVGTVSGTAITFGSAVVFNSGSTLQFDITFDSNVNKVVIGFRDSSNGNAGTGLVGTVSGTSISFGSEYVFISSCQYVAATFDSNSNKVVFGYRHHTTDYAMGIVGTVSGTAISYGSEATAHSVSSAFNAVTFDSNSNKVVLTCRQATNGAGVAVVGTVSGTSISFGTAVTYVASLGSTTTYHLTFDSNSNKVVIGYSDSGNSNYGTAIVGTVSGTSISFGTPVVFDGAGNALYVATVFDSVSNKIVISYRDDSVSNSGTVITGTVSGTSISFSGKQVYNSSSNDIAAVFDVNANATVSAYYDGTNSNYGTASVTTTAFSNVSSYVGITNAAISSGATGEVAVKGGLSTTADLGTASSTFNTAVEVAGDGTAGSILYDPTNNKVIALYADGDNSNYGTAKVGTVSGTSTSWGSATVFESATATQIHSVYDVNAQRVVVVYQDGGNSSYPTVVIGTVAGTGISFGSPVVAFSGAANIEVTYDAGQQKCLVTYRPSPSNSIFLMVGTVSGTSISFGSPLTVSSTAGGGINGIVYDANAAKSVLFWGTGLNAEAAVATISGTSVSVGSTVQYSSGTNLQRGSAVYDSVAQKVVTVANNSNNDDSTANVGTVSGTSISFGTEVIADSTINNHAEIAIVYDVAQNKILHVFSGNPGSGSRMYSQLGAVSGTTTTWSTPVELATNYHYVWGLAYNSSTTSNVLLYSDYGSADILEAQVATIAQDTLVIGSNYFVQDDGSLATTSSTTKAGKAISTTALNLVDPT